MKTFLHLLFAAALFAATIASESHGSDILRLHGDGWYSWHVDSDDGLEIHARIEDGRPTKIMIPDWDCRWREEPDSEDLGVISAADSVDWLRRFVDPDSPLNSTILFAIAAHDDDAAYDYIEHLIFAEN